MKRYYFILASLTSGVTEDRVHQEVGNVLDHIRRSKSGSDQMISMIDVGLWRQEIIEHSQWTSLDDVTDNIDYFLTSWRSSSTPVNSLSQRSLADVLHQLSDDFPKPGTYLSDVVWLISNEEHIPIIQDHVDVFGALMRLRMWHKTFLTFCCGRRMSVTRQLSDWSKHVPVQIFSGPLIASRDVFPAGVIWRGLIRLTDQESGVSHHLEGFQLLSDGSSDTSDHSFVGQFTVTAESELHAVPPHYISPDTFSLVLPPIASNSLLEDSWRFLSIANSAKNHCHVLCLTPPSELTGVGERPVTSLWKQKIASGNFADEDGVGATERRLFLLVGDGLCTAYSAALFELRDPSIFDPTACRELAIRDAGWVGSPSWWADSGSSVATRKRLSLGVPRLRDGELEHLEGAIKEAQSWARDRYANANKSVKPEDLLLLNKAVGSHILNQWKFEFDISQIESGSTLAEETGNADKEIEEGDVGADPPDAWSERQFLRACSLDSGNSGVGLSTATPVLSSLMNADDIRRIFEKDTKWERVLRDSGKHYRSGKHPTVSVLTSWPTARHCNFHDIYYNRGPSGESRQLTSDELRSRLVPMDTISSASVASLRLQSISQPACSSPAETATPLSSPGPPPPPVAVLAKSLQRRHQDTTAAVRRSPRHQRPALMGVLTENHLKKLRGAVLDALESHQVRVDHPMFRDCAKKLFEVSRSFAKDVVGDGGSISRRFREITDSQVKQVISFVHQRAHRDERIRRSGKR